MLEVQRLIAQQTAARLQRPPGLVVEPLRAGMLCVSAVCTRTSVDLRLQLGVFWIRRRNLG